MKDNKNIREELCKQQTLNSSTTKKEIKSKQFFIFAVIGLILTLSFCGLEQYWLKIEEDADFGKNGYYGYFLAELNYKDNVITRSEFKEIENEYKSIERVYYFFGYGKFVVGGITILILATGIALKIKEKGGIRIVD